MANTMKAAVVRELYDIFARVKDGKIAGRIVVNLQRPDAVAPVPVW